MSWFTGILVYAVAWWILFLMALPCGVCANPKPLQGEDPGAPQHPYLLQKVGVATFGAGICVMALLWAYPFLEKRLQHFVEGYEKSYMPQLSSKKSLAVDLSP